eukprot:8015265-Heterocapsa_arctica.AAC.1
MIYHGVPNEYLGSPPPKAPPPESFIHDHPHAPVPQPKAPVVDSPPREFNAPYVAPTMTTSRGNEH